MRWLLVLLLATVGAKADSVIATRLVLAEAVLGSEDMATVDAEIPGALTDPAAAIGLEARVTLYPGRAIRAADLGRPTLVERNALVALSYRAGGLTIIAEGRALARAGSGESLRVMNLSSRTTVTGRLGPDGVVQVGPQN